MLPTWLNGVVVVVVHATDVVKDLWCSVCIDGTALVSREEIFHHSVAHPAEVFQMDIGSEHDVFQWIH